MATEKVSTILQKYISKKIPSYATNIFYQMFTGIDAIFQTLEYKLNISKRERNILTAQSIGSLRSLSAMNGFEPTLKIPAKGLLSIKIDNKLFARFGYPLYIKPYSEFINKLTKIKYIYVGNKVLRLTNGNNIVPVVEGSINTQENKSTGSYIERFYINEENLAEGSIVVQSNGVEFLEVKSFIDNENINNNKQFLVKYSNNPQTPIVIYIKGTELDDIILITYRLCFGENGNLLNQVEFETDNIINNYGEEISPNDDEIKIINIAGFDLGSNGTDENSLRAAIGYNHGSELLFDVISYTNFINKYSLVLLQKVNSVPNKKTIKNIFLSKKQTVIDNGNIQNIIEQYQTIINNNSYLFTESEKANLSNVITEKEFALTSHNIFNSEINKYAFQIKFENNENKEDYSDEIKKILYLEFSKFLYIKNHQINIELLFNDFMIEKNIKFDYTIFNQLNEQIKIEKQKILNTEYIIKHNNILPILKGDFQICDSEFNTYQLFFDINIVSN